MLYVLIIIAQYGVTYRFLFGVKK